MGLRSCALVWGDKAKPLLSVSGDVGTFFLSGNTPRYLGYLRCGLGCLLLLRSYSPEVTHSALLATQAGPSGSQETLLLLVPLLAGTLWILLTRWKIPYQVQEVKEMPGQRRMIFNSIMLEYLTRIFKIWTCAQTQGIAVWEILLGWQDWCCSNAT